MTTTVHPFDLVVSGTVAFQVFQTAEAWFSFGWGLREPGDGLSSGEVALFRIGPG